LSEIVYATFNALLPVVVLLLVRAFDPPYLALVVVLLSKWRILALRPRFWWANVKSNMVDIIVGVGAVGLLYLAGDSLALQLFITALYMLWQLVVKPLSSSHGIMLQAGIAQFVGLVVLFSFSTVLPELIIIFGCWVSGYVTARHLISNYEEPYVELWASLWGLLTAQLGWLLFYWTAAYGIGIVAIQIPQIAIIMLVLGFSGARIYHMQKHETLTSSVLRGTALFTIVLLAIILIFTPWDATL
jgi:hypothetical protein